MSGGNGVESLKKMRNTEYKIHNILKYTNKNSKKFSMKSIKSQEKVSQFVHKLLDMMEKFPSCVSWGCAPDEIVFLNLRYLEQQVLPGYFRHRNISSFIRQLNMYGFCKKTQSEEYLKFTHNIFRQGNECQFNVIKRKSKTKSKSSIKADSPQSRINAKQEQYLQTLKSKLMQPQYSIFSCILQLRHRYQKTLNSLRTDLEDLVLSIKTNAGGGSQDESQGQRDNQRDNQRDAEYGDVDFRRGAPEEDSAEIIEDNQGTLLDVTKIIKQECLVNIDQQVIECQNFREALTTKMYSLTQPLEQTYPLPLGSNNPSDSCNSGQLEDDECSIDDKLDDIILTREDKDDISLSFFKLPEYGRKSSENNPSYPELF